MRILATLIAAMLLSSCAAPAMYQWGGYESMLYQGYKDPTKMEEMKVALQEHVTELEASGVKVPPGLYAELGTLYLQSGVADRAIAMYSRERDAWPESKGLMTAMIQNLERRQQALTGATK